ncbi:MAG: type II secretion system minor pseudopilin GspK [Gammaproteobacteria bacterium]|nr:type II secretion system minor pseudopilin GspK [Gammaproteobacteria bacterium]MBU6508710.1 type II secretion system minor pseudopilin GspK [Gammaproteobacteria bacterium]MDE1982935.1 type II secretion system minor pseudopilin GspK [Gammaproteobacteria bacterium]MDE2108681.1 type II secretion system minor pseudopilin GspK [Gammaproteobacteria bacterium]
MTQLSAQRSRQRGVALLIALVVVAIAATLSTGMIWNRELDIRRTANITQGDQAMEYALGAEAWAEQILRRDYLSSPNNTNLTQGWAMQLPPLPVQGGSITGHLEDLQGLFNVNNLASSNAAQASAALAQFQRLLAMLNLDPEIANATLDWVNAGSQAHFPGGAKDEYYSRLSPAYLTAEQPMTSISELLLVKGVTPQVYAALLPYVCALPLQAPGSSPNGVRAATAININTAPAPVIASLNSGISLEAAAGAVQSRLQAPFQNSSQLQQLLNVSVSCAGSSGCQNTAPLPNTTLTSSFFRLTAQVKIGSTQVTLYSLLYRSGSGATMAVRRTFGSL